MQSLSDVSASSCVHAQPSTFTGTDLKADMGASPGLSGLRGISLRCTEPSRRSRSQEPPSGSGLRGCRFDSCQAHFDTDLYYPAESSSRPRHLAKKEVRRPL